MIAGFKHDGSVRPPRDGRRIQVYAVDEHTVTSKPNGGPVVGTVEMIEGDEVVVFVPQYVSVPVYRDDSGPAPVGFVRRPR